MKKSNGFEDTGELPQIPQNPPQRNGKNASGKSPRYSTESAPTTIRRASMQSTAKAEPVPPQSGGYRRPPGQNLPSNHTKKKKKKKHRSPLHRLNLFGRICVTLVTVVVLLFLVYSGLVLYASRQMQHRETGTRRLNPGVTETDSQIRNLLLIGTDSRGGERGRADTIILLSISKYNKTITMTSLLRDSYVSIPGQGTDKLNAAYAYGGPTLLMDTITNNFGIPVDDYVCVGFTAFVKLADALGGVEITLSDAEAEAVNGILHDEVNGIMGDPPNADYLPKGGTYTLNGKQALSYARIRYVGNADFERTERQRKVLNLFLEKLKHPGFSAVSAIFKDVLTDTSTNLTEIQLYGLSLTVPGKLFSYSTQQLRLPANGTFSDQTAPNGQRVLAVDFDANQELYWKTVKDSPADPEAAETG